MSLASRREDTGALLSWVLACRALVVLVRPPPPGTHMGAWLPIAMLGNGLAGRARICYDYRDGKTYVTVLEARGAGELRVLEGPTILRWTS